MNVCKQVCLSSRLTLDVGIASSDLSFGKSHRIELLDDRKILIRLLIQLPLKLVDLLLLLLKLGSNLVVLLLNDRVRLHQPLLLLQRQFELTFLVGKFGLKRLALLLKRFLLLLDLS